MQINHSNIAFSSKINFVSYDDFDNRVTKNDKGFVSSWRSLPSSVEGDEFYSVQLRTCTGGGIVDTGKKVVGFHFYDNQENLDNADKNVEDLFEKAPNAERGVVIGGKDLPRAECSLPQFEKIKDKFLEKLKAVSIFQTHSYADSETNYHYSVDDDEWTINTQFSVLPGHPKVHDVDTFEKLKSAFDKIFIADGDELLIQDMPVRKEDAPEFFEPIE